MSSAYIRRLRAFVPYVFFIFLSIQDETNIFQRRIHHGTFIIGDQLIDEILFDVLQFDDSLFDRILTDEFKGERRHASPSGF